MQYISAVTTYPIKIYIITIVLYYKVMRKLYILYIITYCMYINSFIFPPSFNSLQFTNSSVYYFIFRVYPINMHMRINYSEYFSIYYTPVHRNDTTTTVITFLLVVPVIQFLFLLPLLSFIVLVLALCPAVSS